MTENALLEPSFADAIAAIEQASDLPPAKRTHWASSLRQIAKALGRPPESIAARWGAVALSINLLHHSNTGVAWKTLANHKSNAKAATHWFQKDNGLQKRGTPLIPEWKALRRKLSDLSRKSKLSGLIRYCSLKGIMPAEVDDTVVDNYMDYRAKTTALATDVKARRAIARAWNASRGLKGWPQQTLTEPPLKATTGWPRWGDFPLSLQKEVQNHLDSLTRPRRGIDGKRLSPCKASTIRTRKVDLVSLAKKAVRLGTPIESLKSLSELLDPVLVENVIDSEWEKAGPEPKTSTIDLGKKAVAVARSVGCLEGPALEQLDEIRAKLEKHRAEGLTPKNMKLIRQILNGNVWKRVVNYPTELMKEARRRKDQSPVKAAVMAEVAVATAIETVAPVRAANLATIRLDENLVRPGGLDSNYLLVFPHYDVKNRVDLTFELDDYLTGLIDEYVQEYRPFVVRGANADWLFPGTDGRPKDSHLFGIQITDRIQKATGLRITLHQFRHAAAAIYLKHHPGDYETVRRLLGHRNTRTTIKFYCGLETIQASREFGKIIREHLRFDPDDHPPEPTP
ncbi:MAG: site-specific integrase [Steroidobacteraceae bacterium]|jgi:integrase